MNNQTIIVTIKDLASELFIRPKSLRKKLRDNGIAKPGTRWEWNEDHETVQTIRSWKETALTGDTVKAATKPKEEVIEGPQVIFTKGNWKVLKGPEGVKASYETEKSNDSTQWITNPENIRPSLPKYIQEEMKKAL